MYRLLLVLLTSCGYQVGRSPAVVDAMVVGEVQLVSAQPGLNEAIRAAVAREGAKRVALGQGPVLSTTVLEAGSRPLSPGGDLRQVELALRFDLEGGRCVVLRGRRAFAVEPNPGVVLAAKEAAMENLAGELVAEGLALLLTGPGGAECP